MFERLPRRRGYWFAVMVTVVMTLIGRAVAAEDQSTEEPRLLVYGDQLADPLVSRVLAELRSQGFEVITVSAAAGGIPDGQVLAMAEAARAVAAVQIRVSEAAVDLKVTDCMTEGTFVRRVAVEDDRTVAALRTVEVLRTRLINLLALAPRRRPRTVEPGLPTKTSAPARVRAPPPRSAFGLALGAAVAQGPGGSTASWQALAAFRWRTPGELLVEALALLPVSQAEFRDREGSARLRLGGGWRRMAADERAVVVTGLGCGLGGHAGPHAGDCRRRSHRAHRHEFRCESLSSDWIQRCLLEDARRARRFARGHDGSSHGDCVCGPRSWFLGSARVVGFRWDRVDLAVAGEGADHESPRYFPCD